MAASELITSLMERLFGLSAVPSCGVDIREIRELENKLKFTEHELDRVKQEVSSQQREEQVRAVYFCFSDGIVCILTMFFAKFA